MFAKIETIQDVLPHIEGRPEFQVFEKDEYDVINYLYQDSETFDSEYEETEAILRDCRGLIFGKDDKLLRRAFHKFFNVNEKPETSLGALPISSLSPNQILHKLDGSMVTPLDLPSGLRWATKMGVTDVSMAAEVYIESSEIDYVGFAESLLGQGYVPIFEWCDPNKPIVIKHEEPSLVLLAIREQVSGNYIPYNTLCLFSDYWDIPLVGVYHDVAEVESVIAHTKDLEDAEGFVVRLDNGFMFKIKGDWYVKIHKVKDDISSEKKLTNLILSDKVDDLKGVLEGETELLEMINKTEKDVRKIIDRWSTHVGRAWAKLHKLRERKDFATEVLKYKSPLVRQILFGMYDNKNGVEIIQAYYLKICSGSGARYDIGMKILEDGVV